mgnify:CR=1 FL=1
MTGQEAIELIHQRAWTGRKPGLERTQALLASLGNPERRLRFVHITGTNGKGSTAAMTASILSPPLPLPRADAGQRGTHPG